MSDTEKSFPRLFSFIADEQFLSLSGATDWLPTGDKNVMTLLVGRSQSEQKPEYLIELVNITGLYMVLEEDVQRVKEVVEDKKELR